MSHGPSSQGGGDDYLQLDPREVLTQYSVEWTALRASYEEVKARLEQVQMDLRKLDEKLAKREITEQEHIQQYKEKWQFSTQIIGVKREVEARLYEIQQQIRAADKKLKEREAERVKREHMEEERSNAMIEWMSLRQGFDLVINRRNEIAAQMDKIEVQRRAGKISEADYRSARMSQIRQLAELKTVETDVKTRLAELLEVIRR
jgi:RNase H-fold protein (predicted Holliday junction resolvase)